MSNVSLHALETPRFRQTGRALLARAAFHPEWWVLALSGLIWVWLLVQAAMGVDPHRAMGHGDMNHAPITAHEAPDNHASMGHDAMVHHPAGVAANPNQSLGAPTRQSGLVSWLGTGMTGWMVMIIAMMFPMMIEPIRHTAFATTRARRHVAIILFLSGYTLFWCLVGLVFLGLKTLLDRQLAGAPPLVGSLAAASGFAFAAVWMMTPSRRMAMAACGASQPLHLNGWKANVDCLRYGIFIGRICVGTCWAPMAALMLANHDLALMFMVTALLLYERYRLLHTSKALVYAWGLIAVFFVGSGLIQAMG